MPIQIEMNAVGIELATAIQPDQSKIPVIIYVDPQSGIRVVIPYGGDSARICADHLMGKKPIVTAQSLMGLPPMPGTPPNGQILP
jgi:hypothetical protein